MTDAYQASVAATDRARSVLGALHRMDKFAEGSDAPISAERLGHCLNMPVRQALAALCRLEGRELVATDETFNDDKTVFWLTDFGRSVDPTSYAV